MNKRCLLHKTKLPQLISWLDANGIAHRPGKGFWQVLQILTEDSGWQVVFQKAEMPEHFSLNEKLIPLIRRFIDESRQGL